MSVEMLTEDSAEALLSCYGVIETYRQLIVDRDETILRLLDVIDNYRTALGKNESSRLVSEEASERMERAHKLIVAELDAANAREKTSREELALLQVRYTDLEKYAMSMKERLDETRKMIETNLKNVPAYTKLMDASRLSVVPPRRSKYIPPPTEEIEFIDDDDVVQLRNNRAYHRRSRSVEPSAVNKRISNGKRARCSRYEDIDEETETEQEKTVVVEAPKPKRSRDSRSLIRTNEITTVTTIVMDTEGKTPTQASVEVRRSKKRSVSASRVLDSTSEQRRLVGRSPRIIGTVSNTDLRLTPTAFGSSWTRGRPISECTHRLTSITTIASMIRNCHVCNKTLNGKRMQCPDCKIFVHEQCRSRAPMPCIPEKHFPITPSRSKVRTRLADLCPSAPPLVPSVLIRCVYQLEKDRLNFEGIYRIPGNRENVEKILGRLQSKTPPTLDSESTEDITGCLKMFLTELRDPVIPRSSYEEFVAGIEDDERLDSAIAELPEPNRDTLAFLCVHFQKIASMSTQNKMPIENLATCVGPTIIGDATAHLNTLGQNSRNIDEAYSVMQDKRRIFIRLLTLPSTYWSEYLGSRMMTVNFTTNTPGVPATIRETAEETTPKMPRSGRSVTRAADASVLGPVTERGTGFTPSLPMRQKMRIQKPY